ncbi:DNA-protecting protein DprA [Candidatus Roizmanbacteria bacterium CG_4_10_14_0_8_um_filter_39_9]|uniref:DNA-protecting protein DprA n=1 Tax=Candidatus Roizmanbacteria bacterium CG_4_10_14_0_8_um_filter_39_9 TaxID=1974829 RepID=A0A2M7QCR3_9BACT|nr:MAG: DNA-protecting protein DprA [Candidatus Roizmanbacteria bacterium CG_4_10_14_0_8_um_filter_39_9]
MIEDIGYYVGFSFCQGIGPMKFHALISAFGSARDSYNASGTQIKYLLGQRLSEEFIAFRNRFNKEKIINDLIRKKIFPLCIDDPAYPLCLKNISDPPICLYIKGDWNKLQFEKQVTISVVGTRKPTSYGQQVARTLSMGLASRGVLIISGMALGVDTIAHQAALTCNTPTIAVLGCGVDIIYPSVNRQLYFDIIKKGGVILSEFPPGHTVLKGLFVARNRIISGLSKGIVVIEGASDSGALITAKYAANQGRSVFAPPSPITSVMGDAPNILLKQGAVFVTSVDDIFHELNIPLKNIGKVISQINLTDEERGILELMKSEPASIDDMVEKTSFAVQTVLSILSSLELKGIVERQDDGRYQIQ